MRSTDEDEDARREDALLAAQQPLGDGDEDEDENIIWGIAKKRPWVYCIV